jgi:hypothetical protein
MPFSWVRISSKSSPKIQRCRDGDPSKKAFEDCVRSIVAEDGGRVESFWFEQNGRYARVRFYWENHEQKTQIIFDLEGEDVIDLLSADEVDKLIGGDSAG